MAEMDDKESSDLIATATWGYLRLRRSDYSRADLLNWKERVLSQPWDHAYVFFKHEDEGIGPKRQAASCGIKLSYGYHFIGRLMNSIFLDDCILRQ